MNDEEKKGIANHKYERFVTNDYHNRPYLIHTNQLHTNTYIRMIFDHPPHTNRLYDICEISSNWNEKESKNEHSSQCDERQWLRMDGRSIDVMINKSFLISIKNDFLYRDVVFVENYSFPKQKIPIKNVLNIFDKTVFIPGALSISRVFPKF